MTPPWKTFDKIKGKRKGRKKLIRSTTIYHIQNRFPRSKDVGIEMWDRQQMRFKKSSRTDLALQIPLLSLLPHPVDKSPVKWRNSRGCRGKSMLRPLNTLSPNLVNIRTWTNRWNGTCTTRIESLIRDSVWLILSKKKKKKTWSNSSDRYCRFYEKNKINKRRETLVTEKKRKKKERERNGEKCKRRAEFN